MLKVPDPAPIDAAANVPPARLKVEANVGELVPSVAPFEPNTTVDALTRPPFWLNTLVIVGVPMEPD